MANQQGAYGDIFLVNTPAIDQLSTRMYQEQKIREARQQQENAALDNQLRSELGKVRSVDTPDIVNAYSQAKDLKKRLLFDKSIQHNPLEYNKVQQDYNKAYSNIFTLANASSEMKDFQKQQSAEYAKNPNGFDDNAGTMLSTAINTPLSQLRNHPQYGDLTNPNTYSYKGSNTNWADHLQKAIGTPKQVYADTKTLDGGFQTQITPYTYGNSPSEVKNYLLGVMATHQAGRDAAYQWDHLPESEIENTIKQYQAIPAQKWQRMGLQGPQDLLSKNPDNKAENFASYQAMKYAIANEPREGTPVFRENKAATLNWQLNKDKIMEGIRHGNREDEIKLRQSLKDKSGEEQDNAVDELYQGVKDDALKNPIPYKPATGQPYNQYQIKATESMKKLFGVQGKGGHTIYPDDLRFDQATQKVIPIFYEHKYDSKGNRTEEVATESDGNVSVDRNLSKPILESEFKERFKRELLGVQAYGKSLTKKPKEEKHVNVEELRKKYNY